MLLNIVKRYRNATRQGRERLGIAAESSGKIGNWACRQAFWIVGQKNERPQRRKTWIKAAKTAASLAVRKAVNTPNILSIVVGQLSNTRIDKSSAKSKKIYRAGRSQKAEIGTLDILAGHWTMLAS